MVVHKIPISSGPSKPSWVFWKSFLSLEKFASLNLLSKVKLLPHVLCLIVVLFFLWRLLSQTMNTSLHPVSPGLVFKRFLNTSSGKIDAKAIRKFYFFMVWKQLLRIRLHFILFWVTTNIIQLSWLYVEAKHMNCYLLRHQVTCSTNFVWNSLHISYLGDF